MSLSLTKMAVLTGYANTISLKEFAKNRLFLVTPAGMISGIPVFDEENSNPNIAVAQTVNSSALKAVSKAASAEEESPQTGESCEFILLKDARLETTSPVDTSWFNACFTGVSLAPNSSHSQRTVRRSP